MPVKKDKIPLLVKISKAQTIGDENVSVYGDWQVVYMSDKSTNNSFSREPYGTEHDFDLTILLDAGPTTRQIVENSVFLINEYPTAANSKGNFRVKKVFPEYLGLIKLGLESIKGNSFRYLYYLDGDNIYSYQLNYDSSTNKGYINKNTAHPFATATKIWLTEPLDKDDSEDMITFVSEQKVGIIDNYKTFIEITFGKS